MGVFSHDSRRRDRYFHYQLGVAITQWANVESEIVSIILTLFPNEKLNHESLSVGFLSIESFRAKTDFAARLVSRKLAGTANLEDWKDLIERARRASSKRNKLAHWQMGKYWECEAGRRVALTPWIYKKRRRKTKVQRPPPASLYIQDVSELSADFWNLSCELENFRYRICAQPEPHKEADEQAPRPLTPAKIARQIREVLAVQPAPSRP